MTSPFCLWEEAEVSGGLPNFEVDQALRRIEEQLSLGEENLKDISGFYIVNESENKLGHSVNKHNYGGSQAMQYDTNNSFASEQ